jgi:xanthine dehydrogenase YagR molybdenum-binding subunit
VVLEIGTQDLGTGTRTAIVMVAAETLGLPLGAITLRIGNSDYPPDGASGGSTTIGGVSPSTLKSTTNARAKIVRRGGAGPGHDARSARGRGWPHPGEGDPSKSLPWQDACRKLGTARSRKWARTTRAIPAG